MHHVEEGALSLLFGWLPDYVSETLLVTRPSPSSPVLMELDETDTLSSLGLLPLQIGKIIL